MHNGKQSDRLLQQLVCLCALWMANSASAQIRFVDAQRALPNVPAELVFAPDTAAIQTDQQPPNPATSRTMDMQHLPLQTLANPSSSLSIEADDNGAGQAVSIYARGVDLRIVLAHLAEESRVNIVVAENVDAQITTTLNKVPLWHALDAILKINGLTWTEKDNIIFVTRPGAGTQSTQSASLPGQQVQVFDLNYTSSKEVLDVVSGLLSPNGKAFAHAVDITSTRQTRERIVVEDFPDRLQAIAGYLLSVDDPPRQVLIEAHVLQVTLDDNQRHGVNLAALARIAGGNLGVRVQGFANGDASPGFMVGIDNTDLDGMLETLCSNSNVRTLAAPKVLVVNGQQARIQIGSKFGYFVTTTTQTSTLQSVNFLDIGVVLQVQPTITRDGQVLLTVEPKVSGGRINPDSGLPEEETTEAATTVLLPDGKGMIIGGLIKESDNEKRWWAPVLGKIPVIKHLFNRRNWESQRVEVILALTPHVVPYGECVDFREGAAYQATTDVTGIIATEPQCLPATVSDQPPLAMVPTPTPAANLPSAEVIQPQYYAQPQATSPLLQVPALPSVPDRQ